jgi:hypothetical protein
MRMATPFVEIRRAERRLRLKRNAADALGLLVLFAVCAFFVAAMVSGGYVR